MRLLYSPYVAPVSELTRRCALAFEREFLSKLAMRSVATKRKANIDERTPKIKMIREKENRASLILNWLGAVVFESFPEIMVENWLYEFGHARLIHKVTCAIQKFHVGPTLGLYHYKR